MLFKHGSRKILGGCEDKGTKRKKEKETTMKGTKILGSLLLIGVLAGCINPIPSGRSIPTIPGRGSQPQRIVYQSKDSFGRPVQTTAKVVKPTDSSGRWPAIVWNHGGKALECTSVKRLREYARLGYVVIGPDYQSCVKAEEHFAIKSQIDDVIGAIDWLKAHPEFVDTSRIFMIGHSYGGAITIRTLDRLTELGRAGDIKAASVEGSVYSYEAMLRSQAVGERVAKGDISGPLAAYMNKYNLTEEEVMRRYRVSLPDMLENHDRAVVPIFIAHGSEDTYVHGDNARQLSGDLAKLGVKQKLKFYPGVKHNLDQSPRWDEYVNDIQAWFRENSSGRLPQGKSVSPQIPQNRPTLNRRLGN
jgi:dipeptidyl aminopeptidase/acylaminoacyl peptidase